MDRKFTIVKIVRLKLPVPCSTCKKEILSGSVALLERGNIFCNNCSSLPSGKNLAGGFMADAREKVKNVFAEAKTEPYAKSEA
jgi:hypothetical protein